MTVQVPGSKGSISLAQPSRFPIYQVLMKDSTCVIIAKILQRCSLKLDVFLSQVNVVMLHEFLVGTIWL